MTHNDILRRLRYAFDFRDSKMMDLFRAGGAEVSRERLSRWLKRDEDADFLAIEDRELAMFLNGLIVDRRGRREGALPEPEERLNNNLILRKLRIALSLQDEGMLELLALGDGSGKRALSKHELSAFFRKPGHKNYRPCKDQVLRQFIQGVQRRFRGEDGGKPAGKAGEESGDKPAVNASIWGR